jgi:cytochrome c biogenesis protein CcdA
MATEVEATIVIARAQEQLRQERETFDQKKRQDGRWFLLRLAMGWSAVVLLPAIGGVSGWVIANHPNFAAGTVTLAASALFVDSIGLVLAVWRIVLGTGPEGLVPVTRKSE